ncbi:enolase C-terminal domain-like protein [Peterkaempfera sp. SMS 1(5)a]|uniref:enolase C-terminal domain-like protein n=1 Tax=Peterkaempfera podocarpi TaxID=3232308 RepID=UPI00366DD070
MDETAGGGHCATLYRSIAADHQGWLLLRLTGPDGVVGWGECTGAGRIADVLGCLASWAGDRPTVAGRTARTVRGALAQALADQAARRLGVPLWQWYGATTRPDPVELFADLGTAAVGRTPADAAQAAADAVAAGYRVLSLAPFEQHGGGPLGEVGLKRVRAVREAVGDGVQILVDCRERLPLRGLSRLLDPLADLGIAWLKDGVGIGRPADLARLRTRTDIPLAGGQSAYDPAQLYAVAGLLDVVLPDVRHAGGPHPALALASAAGGARVSFHNPAGPVATLHSAQLTALRADASLLGLAFDGPSPRGGRTLPGPATVAGGCLTLPDGPGLGCEPDLGAAAVAEVWSGTVRTGCGCCAGACLSSCLCRCLTDRLGMAPFTPCEVGVSAG